jgi:16S rRNA (cytidine1402-2'-O)-methyltransferase
MMNAKLFLVSTPIGNYDDISLRALTILKEVDFIICEEFKEANRLLSHFQIKKELFSVNEHNEEEASAEIFAKIKEGKSAALITDCGTPLFSDPGHVLVRMCINYKIDIVPVPGANSLLPAIIGSGFKPDKFYYAGWLSPKSDIRRKELLQLKSIKEIIIIMETPYRLKAILTDIVKILGDSVQTSVAFNLTLPTEIFYRGTAGNILNIVSEKNLKGEFVLVINNK